MADDDIKNPDDEAQAKGMSKKRLLLIGIPLVVLIAGGGVAAFFLLGDKPDPAAGELSSPPASSEGPAAEAESAGPEKSAAPGDAAAPTSESGDPEKKGAESEESFGMGKTYNFKPFQLNLANPIANHYIRVDISVEYRTPKAEQELERRSPQLRDAIVTIISSKTREFLQNPDGKEQLRAEILRSMNHYMKNKVEQVFITDILIE